jgi:hypothetical protein
VLEEDAERSNGWIKKEMKKYVEGYRRRNDPMEYRAEKKSPMAWPRPESQWIRKESY